MSIIRLKGIRVQPLLVGGHPAIDFVNTVGWRTGDNIREGLEDYQSLIEWCTHAGVIESGEARALRARAGTSPQEAGRVLREALTLREAIYQVLAAKARSRPIPREALDTLHQGWSDAVRRGTLERADDRVSLTWPIDLRLPRWRLAQRVIELLASDELQQMKECDGANCGWLFIDRSRNRTRRWCSSADCGNRERVKAFLARKKK